MQKPVCLVRETDPNKGGVPLAALKQQCPEDYRPEIFARATPRSGEPRVAVRAPHSPIRSRLALLMMWSDTGIISIFGRCRGIASRTSS